MPRKPTQAERSEAARILQSLRKTRGGGRPRSTDPRCPCGVMTLKRAELRGPSRDHKPECPFYPTR